MSEESRLGRQAIETAYALKQLVQVGIRVFFLLDALKARDDQRHLLEADRAITAAQAPLRARGAAGMRSEVLAWQLPGAKCWWQVRHTHGRS